MTLYTNLFSWGLVFSPLILWAEKTAVFDCRKTSVEIAVDGKLEEWEDVAWVSLNVDEHLILYQEFYQKEPDYEKNFAAKIGLMHDQEYLYIAIRVNDPEISWNDSFQSGTSGEGVELLFDMLLHEDYPITDFNEDDYHFYFPPSSVNRSQASWFLFHPRKLSLEGESAFRQIQSRSLVLPEGYQMEIRIPWSGLALFPSRPSFIGFNVIVNNLRRDGTLDQIQYNSRHDYRTTTRAMEIMKIEDLKPLYGRSTLNLNWGILRIAIYVLSGAILFATIGRSLRYLYRLSIITKRLMIVFFIIFLVIINIVYFSLDRIFLLWSRSQFQQLLPILGELTKELEEIHFFEGAGSERIPALHELLKGEKISFPTQYETQTISWALPKKFNGIPVLPAQVQFDRGVDEWQVVKKNRHRLSIPVLKNAKRIWFFYHLSRDQQLMPRLPQHAKSISFQIYYKNGNMDHLPLSEIPGWGIPSSGSKNLIPSTEMQDWVFSPAGDPVWKKINWHREVFEIPNRNRSSPIEKIEFVSYGHFEKPRLVGITLEDENRVFIPLQIMDTVLTLQGIPALIQQPWGAGFYYPFLTEQRKNISISKSGDKLSLLVQGVLYQEGVGRGFAVGQLRIRFEEGTTQTVPLIWGVNIFSPREESPHSITLQNGEEGHEIIVDLQRKGQTCNIELDVWDPRISVILRSLTILREMKFEIEKKNFKTLHITGSLVSLQSPLAELAAKPAFQFIPSDSVGRYFPEFRMGNAYYDSLLLRQTPILSFNDDGLQGFLPVTRKNQIIGVLRISRLVRLSSWVPEIFKSLNYLCLAGLLFVIYFAFIRYIYQRKEIRSKIFFSTGSFAAVSLIGLYITCHLLYKNKFNQMLKQEASNCREQFFDSFGRDFQIHQQYLHERLMSFVNLLQTPQGNIFSSNPIFQETLKEYNRTVPFSIKQAYWLFHYEHLSKGKDGYTQYQWRWPLEKFPWEDGNPTKIPEVGIWADGKSGLYVCHRAIFSRDGITLTGFLVIALDADYLKRYINEPFITALQFSSSDGQTWSRAGPMPLLGQLDVNLNEFKFSIHAERKMPTYRIHEGRFLKILDRIFVSNSVDYLVVQIAHPIRTQLRQFYYWRLVLLVLFVTLMSIILVMGRYLTVNLLQPMRYLFAAIPLVPEIREKLVSLRNRRDEWGQVSTRWVELSDHLAEEKQRGKERKDQFEILYQFERNLEKEPNLSWKEHFFQLLPPLIPADQSILAMPQQNSSTLEIVGQRGLAEKDFENYIKLLDELRFILMDSKNKILWLRHPHSSGLVNKTNVRKMEELVCYGLKIGSNELGISLFVNFSAGTQQGIKPKLFSAQTVRIAFLGLQHLVNAMQHQELKAKQIYKDLTGLFLPWYFDKRFDEEIERAARFEQSLTYLKIVIVGWEELSVNFSPELLIKYMAERIQESKRSIDIAGFADEKDFQILLPETPISQIMVFVNRLKDNLKRQPFFYRERKRKIETPQSIEIQWESGASGFPETARTKMGLRDKAEAELRRILPRVGEMVPSQPSRPLTPMPDINITEEVVRNKEMMNLYDQMLRVAESNATILLLGESGVGKSYFARLIHEHSNRAGRAFVTVSCASIPETLMESELFGHEKGAFTDADKKKLGRFEEANEGTIFLDEIGEINLATQVKLLRFLQEKKFDRLGGRETISADVRIIAATNRDLTKLIKEGKFREDIYFRINVISFVIPPLRERTEEIPNLVDYFIKRFNQKNSKNIKRVSPHAMELICEYHWPGNIRELENCIERAVVMCKGAVISDQDIAVITQHRRI